MTNKIYKKLFKGRIASAYSLIQKNIYWKIHYALFGMPFVPYHISYYLVRRYCNITTNCSVLDLGCGEGALLNQLAIDYGITGVGLDLMQHRLDQAIQVSKTLKLPIRYFNADATRYKSNKSFNACIIFDVLEHIPNISEVLKVAYNHLKEDGRICIRVPYGEDKKYIKLEEHFSYGEDHHEHSGFTEDALQSYLENAGFTVTNSIKHYYKLSELLYEILEVVRRKSRFLHSLLWPLLLPFFKIEFVTSWGHKEPHGLLIIASKKRNHV